MPENRDNSPSKLLVLPKFIYMKKDVLDLIHEVVGIEEFLYKSQIRTSGAKISLPKTTKLLDSFAETNNRNILHHGQRMEMAAFLRKVYNNAPEVSVYVRQKSDNLAEGIVEWFRSNIHAQTLVRFVEDTRVGVGCAVRIKHKTYNITLQNRMKAIPLSLTKE